MRGRGGGGGEGEVPNVTVLPRLGWVSVVKQSSYPKLLAAAAQAGGRYQQHLSCKTQSGICGCCGKSKPQNLGRNVRPKELSLLRHGVRKESCWAESRRGEAFTGDLSLFPWACCARGCLSSSSLLTNPALPALWCAGCFKGLL